MIFVYCYNPTKHYVKVGYGCLLSIVSINFFFNHFMIFLNNVSHTPKAASIVEFPNTSDPYLLVLIKTVKHTDAELRDKLLFNTVTKLISVSATHP